MALFGGSAGRLGWGAFEQPDRARRWFGDASPPVNHSVPKFEETYAWGARPHPSRNGGPAVNSGLLFRFSRMSTGVRGLARSRHVIGLGPERRLRPISLSPLLLPAL